MKNLQNKIMKDKEKYYEVKVYNKYDDSSPFDNSIPYLKYIKAKNRSEAKIKTKKYLNKEFKGETDGAVIIVSKNKKIKTGKKLSFKFV